MALADWDSRLLSPGRALELAGDWPVYATFEISKLSEYQDQADQWQINLRCRKDGQSVGLLASGAGQANVCSSETSIGDLLSAVVRHMVTAHDLSLSGAGRDLPPEPPIGPLVISGPEEHARFIDALTEDDHG